jgi:hypothetical protein
MTKEYGFKQKKSLLSGKSIKMSKRYFASPPAGGSAQNEKYLGYSEAKNLLYINLTL